MMDDIIKDIQKSTLFIRDCRHRMNTCNYESYARILESFEALSDLMNQLENDLDRFCKSIKVGVEHSAENYILNEMYSSAVSFSAYAAHVCYEIRKAILSLEEQEE